MAASIPATSEYSCLASARLKESSLVSVTFFTGDVNPILVMAQTLSTTNPSEFVGGFKAHALSFFAPNPCSPCRNSTTYRKRLRNSNNMLNVQNLRKFTSVSHQYSLITAASHSYFELISAYDGFAIQPGFVQSIKGKTKDRRVRGRTTQFHQFITLTTYAPWSVGRRGIVCARRELELLSQTSIILHAQQNSYRRSARNQKSREPQSSWLNCFHRSIR